MRHTGKNLLEKDGFNIIECEQCGFKHIYPFPTIEDTNQLYSEEYYEKNKADYIKNLEEDKKWWQLIYQERINVISKYLGKRDNPISALDIGSGAGYFLTEATQKEWLVRGIEPSFTAARYGQENGLNIINTFYNSNVSSKIGKFDVVHMNHVLEHLINPIQTLKLIQENLKKDGILCIAVPNDFNSLQKILVEYQNYKPWWVVPKEHINYFSFDSLINLLNKNGYTILEKSTSFPMELFLLMGEKYIGNAQLGRECHAKRKSFEELLFNYGQEVKSKFYSSLAENNLGRDIIIYARKE